MKIWMQWLLVVLFALPYGVSADVQEVLKSLEGLSPEERQERLIEGAKKEGEVMLYSSSGRKAIKAITKQFGKKYPFLEVRFLKKGGSSLFKVVLLEQKGGKAIADVYWAGVPPR